MECTHMKEGIVLCFCRSQDGAEGSRVLTLVLKEYHTNLSAEAIFKTKTSFSLDMISSESSHKSVFSTYQLNDYGLHFLSLLSWQLTVIAAVDRLSLLCVQ